MSQLMSTILFVPFSGVIFFSPAHACVHSTEFERAEMCSSSFNGCDGVFITLLPTANVLAADKNHFGHLMCVVARLHISINRSPVGRNAEAFGMNPSCRLHGSPKNQATNTSASPLHHRLQSLDLMDDIPLTFCKETSTNSPILTTPIIEHNKIITPRRQLHGVNDDLSSSMAATAAATTASSTGITTTKNKLYGSGGGGGSMSHCGSINGINIVSSSTYNCDASGSSATGHHHQKQSTSTAVPSSSSHSHFHSHSKPMLHRSFSHQDQAPKMDDRCGLRNRWQACPELHKAMDGVNYIADHTRKEEESTKVISIMPPMLPEW